MTKLRLLATSQNPPVVTQARVKREWMDNTYAKHAYQCLPMTMANVYGWEMQLPTDVVVQWDGGNTTPQILEGAEFEGRQVCSASIIGQISFHVGYVFKTQEPYEVWLSALPNFDYFGAIPLSAYIPSSWWPDEVFMNWRIEKIGEPVKFEAGSPFAFFTIIDTSTLMNTEIEIGNLWGEVNQDHIDARMKYSEEKTRMHTENPWKGWMRGIKTGVDASGNRLHEPFTGLPKFAEPSKVQMPNA
jgi:hypothetical protein